MEAHRPGNKEQALIFLAGERKLQREKIDGEIWEVEGAAE